jgi:mono/diheme cytochrome c family protein
MIMHTYRLMLSLVLLMSCGSAYSTDYVAMTGKDLYLRFCASCHGATGRGDGPVAASFSVEVPDLTLIARRAKGVYPRDNIVRIIDGRHIIGAHGARTMPVWGEDFTRLGLGDPDAERGTRVIIDRLAEYVWLLQKPASQSE